MYPQALSLAPDELCPNPWNTNFVSPENEAKLDEALRRLGMFKPVIVRETPTGYEILGGEHRAAAAQRVGLETIPVMNLGPIDDQRAKEIGIADNSRYGADDSHALGELLNELGSSDDLAQFLPFTDSDIKALFLSVDHIALDELDDLESDEPASESDAPEPSRAAKTHTVMRFKVALADAERLVEKISRTQKRHGYNLADDLTNAGDALVHMLLHEGEDKSILTLDSTI